MKHVLFGHLYFLLSLTLLLPSPALADPEDTNLSLTPWTGTVLQITDSESRVTGAFAANIGHGVWGSGEMSLPLPPNSQEVTLLDEDGNITEFTYRLTLAWDSTYGLLDRAEGEDLKSRMAFCSKYNIPDCTDSAIREKLSSIEDDLGQYHNIRPSGDIGNHYSLGLEFAGSYGGIQALEDPSALETQLYHDIVAESSLALTFFRKRAIFSLRPGAGLSQDVKAEQIQLCSDDGAGQQVCVDRMSLKEPVLGTAAAHLRLAATFWDTESRLSGDLSPGIEVRTNVEGIGANPTLLLRVTGFVGPKIFPLGLRSGVGVDTTFALSPGATEVFLGVRPFAFVGATFDGLGNPKDVDP